jgi:hypothetical protein
LHGQTGAPELERERFVGRSSTIRKLRLMGQ